MSCRQGQQSVKRLVATLDRVNGFQGDRPNIIIINCDDLGYGDLPAYGGTTIKTPNIDKLAENGVKFTSFYSCNAVCTPSRFGLLTGRYPRRAGLDWVLLPHVKPGNNFKSFSALYYWFGWGLYRALSKMRLMDYGTSPAVKGILDEEITLAGALKTAGYRTGMVGKWHLGEFPIYPRFNPVRHGFDFFYGVPHSNDMKGFALYRNEECLSSEFTDMDKLTGLYTQEALKFIGESGDSQFFLYFAHTYPHQPLFASAPFKGRSQGGRYGDTVEEIDWSVGEIVRVLTECGIVNNTLLVFTSDNGPWYNGNPGKLRGRKGQSYEGGFRIPMIAQWPGRIPTGTVCSEPAMNIDWFPTCLALAGLASPGDRIIDGEDITGLLTGKLDKSPHECLYFYHNENLEAIRMGKWKYIPKINTYVWPLPMDKYWPSAGHEQAPWLYNLETDPNESYNMRDDNQDIIQKMDYMFRQWDKQMKENLGGNK